jgi:DNA mismatch endonuclease, patch repair protein
MSLKAPSFSDLRPTSRQASESKKANSAKNTLPELLLVRELRKNGLRFKRHVSVLPGKPEVVFEPQRVVVFCDGDFWHGRNWKARESRLEAGSNATYWTAKIKYNIMRDRTQTRLLKQAGWQVIRLWETDLKRDPGKAVNAILQALENPKPKDAKRKPW